MKDSSKRKPVLIRADAGGILGSGHVMRMIALAQALRQRGIEAVFASVQCHQSMLNRTETEGFKHHLFENAHLGNQSDAEQSIALAKQLGCEWVYLDGYHFDLAYQKQVHTSGLKVAIMEDDDHCEEWCADLIVNQNLGAEGKVHSNILPEGQSLSGCCFALLREEFLSSSSPRRDSQWPPKRILITMGGVDPDDASGLILRSLETLEAAELEVKVIVGGGNPNRENLESFAQQSKHQVDVLINVTDMPALYQWADAAITAGGSTCYEWMRYELSASVVTIADNQEPLVDALVRNNAALTLGRIESLTTENASKKLRDWFAQDAPPLHEQRVDAKGARRVAAALDNQLSISIASAEGSWINASIESFVQTLKAEGHSVASVHNANEAPASDILFLLSYWEIVSSKVRAKHAHTLVVHESNLPKGRGWSPVTWQILEGFNQIPVCLLEAVDAVDAGNVYLRSHMQFKGDELIDEVRQSQATATFELCKRFIENYPAIASQGAPQEGVASEYPRRRPKDSELDTGKTLIEQFNQLRVADNDAYPAFFNYNGQRYILKIERADETE